MADAFIREGLPVLTKTSPEAGRIFAVPTITSLEEARAAITNNPGLEVEGLGQLPKVLPLEKPQGAFRSAEGAPDAGLMEEVLKMTGRDEGRDDEDVMERVLVENFAVSLIAQFGGKLQDREIEEILGYHKNQGIRALEGKRLGIEARSREDHEGDFQDAISQGIIKGWYREICRNANLNITGCGYGIFAEEGLPAAIEHIRKFAESILPDEFEGIKEQVLHHAEKIMKDVSMHRADLTADYYVRGHFAGLIHETRGFFQRYYGEKMEKMLDEKSRKWKEEDLTICRTLADALDMPYLNPDGGRKDDDVLYLIERIDFRQRIDWYDHLCGFTDSPGYGAFREGGEQAYREKLNEYLDEHLPKEFEPIRERIIKNQVGLVHFVDSEGMTKPGSDRANYYYPMLVSDNEEFFRQLYLRQFEAATASVRAVEKLPAKLQEIYEEAIAKEDEGYRMSNLTDRMRYGCITRPGDAKYTFEEMKAAAAYLEAHRKRPGEERILVGGKAAYEMKDSSKDSLNSALADPGLPSGEALAELRKREKLIEAEPAVGFEEEWQLVKRMAEAEGVEADEWQTWALATKRLGLSAQARRERNSNMRLKKVRGDGDTAVTVQEDDFSGGLRFPSKEEIREIVRELNTGENKYIGRNFAHNRVSPVLNPIRTDREQALEKYHFTPDEWTDIYAAIYQAIKLDFFRDDRPDSFACAYRSSIINAMTGRHEQFYKRYISFSDMATHFDEFDLIMFLPAIAAENNNDPGYMLTAYKALLQLDDNLRRLYAPEIRAAFKKLEGQIPVVEQILADGADKADGWRIPRSGVVVNFSGSSKARERHDENAVLVCSRDPDLTYRRGEPSGWGFTGEYENGKPTYILILTRAQYQEAMNLKKGTVLNGRVFDGNSVHQAAEFLFNDGNKVDGWSRAGHIPIAELEVAGYPASLYEVGLDDDRPWVDPDIIKDERTGLLSAKEIALPHLGTAIERMSVFEPALAEKVAEVVLKEKNTQLEPLAAAMDLVMILTGEKQPPEDLSAMLRYGDRVLQVAAQLRGASREEAERLLALLREPINLNEMTAEGIFMQVWQAAGHLEREAIARDIIKMTSAAFRISVKMILGRIEEHRMGSYSLELQEALDIGPDAAFKMARESVAFGFYEDNLKFQQELGELFGISTYDQTRRSREMNRIYKGMIEKTKRTMRELAAVTDYQFASPHWRQIIDQLWGKGNDQFKGFLEGEGRIDLYCVQATFLLSEMLQDLYDPAKDRKWVTPMDFSIVWEDEHYDLDAEKYLEELKHQGEAGVKRRDSYDHYHVLMKLPRSDEKDIQYYLLLDQTMGTIRLFTEEAIKETPNQNKYGSGQGELVIDNRRARTINVMPPEVGKAPTVRVDKHDITKIVIAENLADQSLSVTAQMMEDVDSLFDYRKKLETRDPHEHFHLAKDTTADLEERKKSLQTILLKYPFFIGIEGFTGQYQYLGNLMNLMDLSNNIDNPVGGLFIARIFQIRDPVWLRGKRLVDNFIEKCALLPETQWKIQKSKYDKLITSRDAKQIEERREDIKRKAANADELRKTAEARFKKASRKITSSLSIKIFAEAFEELQKEQPTAYKPGSAAREKAMSAVIKNHSKEMETALQDPTAKLLPEEVKTKAVVSVDHPSTDLARVVRINPALPLTQGAADQAALWLANQLENSGMGMTEGLEGIAALFRAGLAEGRAGNKELVEKSWRMINAAFARALADKTEIPADMPLGELAILMALPVAVVRRRISKYLKNGGLPMELEGGRLQLEVNTDDN